MNNEFLDGILDLIPDAMFPPGRERTRDLRIEEDLCIYGDDAVEFIEKFSKKFNVDISGLDLNKYFTKETSFYFLKKFFISKKKKPLTLGDLEDAINKGKLT